MSSKPTLDTFDPTPPAQQGAQGAAGNFLQNLFAGGFGGAMSQMPNIGEDVNLAAQPLFQQNLAAALGGLQTAAPGRFGSAFVQQGTDLSSQALQDFNLFQQQNLMQGQLANQQFLQALMMGGLQWTQPQGLIPIVQPGRGGLGGFAQGAVGGGGAMALTGNPWAIGGGALLGGLGGLFG